MTREQARHLPCRRIGVKAKSPVLGAWRMTATRRSMESRASGPLKGRLRVPGDKSISHRSLILGGLAVGRTRVTGLLEGEDVLRTAAAMRAYGAGVERNAD